MEVNLEKEMERSIPLIKEQIRRSPYNILKIKVKDFKKEVEFEKMPNTELYRVLKSVLFKYGIGLEIRKNDEIVIW